MHELWGMIYSSSFTDPTFCAPDAESSKSRTLQKSGLHDRTRRKTGGMETRLQVTHKQSQKPKRTLKTKRPPKTTLRYSVPRPSSHTGLVITSVFSFFPSCSCVPDRRRKDSRPRAPSREVTARPLPMGDAMFVVRMRKSSFPCTQVPDIAFSFLLCLIPSKLLSR